MPTFTDAKRGLKAVFDAVPPGKFRFIMDDASNLEDYVNRSAAALNTLRQYFLDTTGEESPFVKKIDELVPRQEKK